MLLRHRPGTPHLADPYILTGPVPHVDLEVVDILSRVAGPGVEVHVCVWGQCTKTRT